MAKKVYNAVLFVTRVIIGMLSGRFCTKLTELVMKNEVTTKAKVATFIGGSLMGFGAAHGLDEFFNTFIPYKETKEVKEKEPDPDWLDE